MTQQEATALVPAPHGGSPDEWKAWAENLSVSIAMGLRCDEIGPGHAVIRFESDAWPLNPNGAVHGGLVAAWADHCLGIASATVAREGTTAATAAMTVQYVRPAIPPLLFTAQVQRSGRTLAFITVEVTDRDGRLATIVNGTMSVDGSSRFLSTT